MKERVRCPFDVLLFEGRLSSKAGAGEGEVVEGDETAVKESWSNFVVKAGMIIAW